MAFSPTPVPPMPHLQHLLSMSWPRGTPFAWPWQSPPSSRIPFSQTTNACSRQLLRPWSSSGFLQSQLSGSPQSRQGRKGTWPLTHQE